MVTTFSLERRAIVVRGLKAKRRQYSKADKESILQAAKEFGLSEAVRRACQMSGYANDLWRQCNKTRVDGGPASTTA